MAAKLCSALARCFVRFDSGHSGERPRYRTIDKLDIAAVL